MSPNVLPLFAAAIAVAALTGCESPQTTEDPNNGTNGPITEEHVTLRDGSTVTCLTYDRALDCNWSTR